jgi:hypothetical protein
MAEISITQDNWAGGELSPKLRSRSELPVYKSGAERIVNFIPEAGGSKRFRCGFQYIQNTRRHASAWLLPFQFNDSDAYELAFTSGYIRFFRIVNDVPGIITVSPKTISGAVVVAGVVTLTITSHGYSNGDEIIVNDVVGMTQLNNRSFVITGKTTHTVNLLDSHGSALDGSAFDTYVSGGTSEKIYEIVSPYLIEDIPHLKIGQNADVLYIDHHYYEPRKLTRSSSTSWALARYTRTSDPFLDKKTITGITQDSPTKVTISNHGYATGDTIIIEDVVGMVEVNSRFFTIIKTGTDDFTLDGVDSTNYVQYSSGGYASNQKLLPSCLAFYQGRLYHAGSDAYPESLWASKPLAATGDPQYDDYSLDSAQPADAFKITLSPISMKVDKIESLVPCLNFLAVCTFEGISKLDGAGSAVEPGSVEVTPVVGAAGCLQQITPHLLGISMMYFHRSGLILYSLEFDIFYNAYNALDKNMSNDQWPESGIAQMCYSVSRPSGFWFVRNDGILIWLSYMVKENINGSCRLPIGGTSPKVLSIGVMPRTNKYDQLWIISERVIDGETCRFVECQVDDPIFPEEDDYWSGDENEIEDDLRWRNAMFEAQKQCQYLDASLTYDGTDYGVVAGATLTPAALTGNSIILTASAPVFNSAMVDRELWKQAQSGVGSGRARIIQYVDTTHVVCDIISDFDTLDAIPAGQWYLTTNSLSGLWHLEGETVSIVADGGEHVQQEVVGGYVSIQYQASIVHIGLGYFGFTRSMHIGSNSPQVPSEGRSMNINRCGVKFLNTLGARYGTDLYKMKDFQFARPADLTGRPSPLFSEHLVVPVEDTSEYHKHFYIQQVRPMPCAIQDLTLFVEFDER